MTAKFSAIELMKLNFYYNLYNACNHVCLMCCALFTDVQRDPMRHDGRLYHPKQHSEITKFMDAYWRQKEQEKLQQ